MIFRRETTMSWLTPRPTCSSFSSSFHYFFWFTNKSLLGILFEEGDNYVLDNTFAYLVFLLIIILSFFWFPNKSIVGILFEEGDNYVLANTSTSLLFLLNIIPSFLSFFGFLTKVFLEFFLRRETTTSWLTPRPTCSSFSSSLYHVLVS